MSYRLDNKHIITSDIIHNEGNTNRTQKGGNTIETLSVPFGLLLLNQVLPVDTSKNIYDIKSHNYIEELSENEEDTINDSLYDKLVSILNLSNKATIKKKTKKIRPAVKRKNRITKRKY